MKSVHFNWENLPSLLQQHSGVDVETAILYAVMIFDSRERDKMVFLTDKGTTPYTLIYVKYKTMGIDFYQFNNIEEAKDILWM